ncbi:MAG: LPS export ABC transporter periplasmic protein LptC [Candidatus Protistobacter heckmanni]|nr:LPS export ABC transporter periplasmic protein LptC [Candidatus Protistobacter heckmanni]
MLGVGRVLEALIRFVPLLAMVALAGGTFWLVTLNTSSPEVEGPKRHIAGYYADKFSASILSEAGVSSYRLQGSHLTSFDDDGSMDVELPAVRAFRPDQPAVTLHAQRGHMTGDMAQVELFGAANLVRDSSPTAEPLSAESEYFLVLVNDDIIRTDKPTVLRAGSSVMYGNSMVFNNINRELKLGGNVHGTIERRAGRR